jgi:hypothetical protein
MISIARVYPRAFLAAGSVMVIILKTIKMVANDVVTRERAK